MGRLSQRRIDLVKVVVVTGNKGVEVVRAAMGNQGCEGTLLASLERRRWSQGWKAPWVRLTVDAFASVGMRRPFKARNVSA